MHHLGFLVDGNLVNNGMLRLKSPDILMEVPGKSLFQRSNPDSCY
jgi:hypothetical protein